MYPYIYRIWTIWIKFWTISHLAEPFEWNRVAVKRKTHTPMIFLVFPRPPGTQMNDTRHRHKTTAQDSDTRQRHKTTTKDSVSCLYLYPVQFRLYDHLFVARPTLLDTDACEFPKDKPSSATLSVSFIALNLIPCVAGWLHSLTHFRHVESWSLLLSQWNILLTTSECVTCLYSLWQEWFSAQVPNSFCRGRAQNWLGLEQFSRRL